MKQMFQQPSRIAGAKGETDRVREEVARCGGGGMGGGDQQNDIGHRQQVRQLFQLRDRIS